MVILLGASALASTAVPSRTQAIEAPEVSASGDEERFRHALAVLEPQRPGTVDAYVIVAALDPAPVFEREAREAARVLAWRFDAGGRTLVLTEDEGEDRADAAASPERLAEAIRVVAAVMDRN
jgi:hypothetical protein